MPVVNNIYRECIQCFELSEDYDELDEGDSDCESESESDDDYNSDSDMNDKLDLLSIKCQGISHDLLSKKMLSCYR